MARDLAQEIEAELEAEHGKPATFVDFSGKEYERVRFRLAGEHGERTCAWGFDEDDEVVLDPNGGSATMNRQITARRFEQRPAQRLSLMSRSLPDRLDDLLRRLDREDRELANHLLAALLARDAPPARALAAAKLTFGDDDFIPCPPSPWDSVAPVKPAAIPLHPAAAPHGGGDFAPCPPSPWG